MPLVGQVGGPKHDCSAFVVVHEHVAVAVEHWTARRLDPDRAQLVVLRDAQILVARQDLQSPQPEEERTEDEQHDPAEHRDAKRRLRRQPVRLLDPRIRREEGAASQASEPPRHARASREAAAAS